jgi:hypothetical protein
MLARGLRPLNPVQLTFNLPAVARPIDRLGVSQYECARRRPPAATDPYLTMPSRDKEP